MRKKWNKKPVILTAAALALTGAVSVGSALAYFTIYTTASGGVQMDMGFTDTTIDEEIEGGTKVITIRNTGDYDCYVRVQIFADSVIDYDALMANTDGTGWSLDGDGYWYYEPVLGAGASTEQLVIDYADLLPDDFQEGQEVNIIVVYESTPVIYDSEGNTDADWTNKITGTTGTEQEGE